MRVRAREVVTRQMRERTDLVEAPPAELLAGLGWEWVAPYAPGEEGPRVDFGEEEDEDGQSTRGRRRARPAAEVAMVTKVRKCVGCRRPVTEWKWSTHFGKVCPHCDSAQDDAGAALQGIGLVNGVLVGLGLLTVGLYWLVQYLR